jgi:tripartite-type tricarboxylate transporter receptor subunit TctC
MVELLAGRVDFLFDTFPSARGHIESGKVRALGVTSSTRVPVAKDILTMEELGYKGCIWQSFIGVLAPAGTPAAVIERLERETAKMNEMPEVQQRLLAQGLVPTNIVGKQYAAFITAETDRTVKLIRDAKLNLES